MADNKTSFTCRKCSRVFQTEEKLAEHDVKTHHPFQSDEELDLVAKQVIWDTLRSDGSNTALNAKCDKALSHRATEAKKEQTRSATLSTLSSIAAKLSQGDKDQYRKLLCQIKPAKQLVDAINSDAV